MHLSRGTVLNKKYLILDKIGEGGFSYVYKARNDQMQIVVVKEFFWHECQERDINTMKVITRDRTSDAEEMCKKFRREYQKISEFDHLNIIQVYDAFEENKTSYYVMEYIEGGVSLRTYCDERRRAGVRITEREAIDIVTHIADALSVMHDKKYNHSDVKPENILIDKVRKRAVLIDFGTAHQYSSIVGSVVGANVESEPIPVYSQGFTHPNISRMSTDFMPCKDVYSLGVTLNEMLLGLTYMDNGMSQPTKNAIAYATNVSNFHTCIRSFVRMLPKYRIEVNLSERVTRAVKSLQSNQVFVFGSNIWGIHNGGAARQALQKWGAIWGVAVGPQGQTYAIPTVSGRANNVKLIEPYVKQFEKYAIEHPELEFLVTEVGCGRAGFNPRQIAPFFKGCSKLPNVCLPKRFWEVLSEDFYK